VARAQRPLFLGRNFLGRNLAKLAEYQPRVNELEHARANLGEAEHLAETTDEKMHLAEIISRRGRIYRAEGDYDQARCASNAPLGNRASKKRACSN
jgi:hypothetical protein